jgi:four helix bundle protein
MKYKSFEELPVWKEAIRVGKEIYLLTNAGKFEKDYTLKEQIRKAVISISSNIAEGFERSNNNEFIRFLLIAKGSVGEVKSQLYFAFILGYIDKDVFNNFNSKLEVLAKQIGSFISYLKNQKAGGKFLNK